MSQPLAASTRTQVAARWRRQAPAALALLPAAVIVVAIYIGAMVWTVRLSFSSSKMLPVFDFVGLQQFQRLFATERFVASGWHILLFGVLFIAGALVLGFLLAVFIDQHVRAEGVFRTIFLYPYAMSFIVTGLAWQWFLHPELGLQKAVRDWGFTCFTFDWIVQPNMVMYTLVIAGDLAGLRPRDGDHARGASRRRRRALEGGAHRRHPAMAHLSVDRPADADADAGHRRRAARGRGAKLYDLVVAMTKGGPGHFVGSSGEVHHGQSVRALQRRARLRRGDRPARHRGRDRRAVDLRRTLRPKRSGR